MKKKILFLSICLLLGTIVVCGVVIVSNNQNHKENSFIRLLPPHVLDSVRHLELEVNSYYIAGVTDHHIFLGNHTSPVNLLQVNYSLTDSQRIILPVPDSIRIAWGALKVSIDSPYLFMAEGISPMILKAEFPFKNLKILQPKSRNISKIQPISSNSFVFRMADSIFNRSTLTKEQISPTFLKTAKDALEQQIDGTFCVDGSFSVNKNANRVVYSYYYRNQFICMDTNLNLIYRARTIDTNTVAKISVSEYTQNGQQIKKLSSPPQIVNKYISVSDGLVYINSQLKGMNEENVDYEYSSPIDIYDLTTGEYQRSFYLPNPRGKKISDFIVHGTHVVVLNGQYLTTYLFSP